MKKDFIKIAIQNVARHWRKSMITGSCICLGFTGILLLGGYMVRMERYLTTQGIYLNYTGHVTIYKKNGLERHLVEPFEHSFGPNLQNKIIESLIKLPEVEKIGRFIHGQGLITNGCKSFPFIVWASEPGVESYLRQHPLVQSRIPLLTKLKSGKGFWNGDDSGILVTKRLSELLDKPLVQGQFGERPEFQDQLVNDCSNILSFTQIKSHSGIQLLGNSFEGGLATADSNILGHFSTGFAFSEDSSILMPLELAQNFFGTDNVTSIGIFLKTASDTEKIKRWINLQEKIWNIPLDVYAYSEHKVNPFYVGAMRFVYIMNLFFFVIVCGVVILALLNAIQIAILERKSEIGTYLAIGYRRSHVRNLFEIEALITACTGLVIGLFLSLFLALIVNSLEIPFDIVGNAEKLYLKLEIEWWYSLGLFMFFLFLVYAATSLICRRHLNVPVMKLLERAD